MLEVFQRLGSIQFDPLAVAGRNHDLVLHARVADNEPAWCEQLYERRQIFEAHNKGLSLVPTNEFPWFRGSLSRTAPRILAENAEVAERVRGFAPRRTEGFVDAMRGAPRAYLRFARASRLEWASPLWTEKRLFLAAGHAEENVSTPVPKRSSGVAS